MAESLPLTIGAIEIGIMISSLLYGATCVQVYLYASSTRQRSRILSILVTLVMILETTHLVFMWIYFFDMTVTHFGEKDAIGRVTWRFGVTFGAHALLSSTIQIFFCYRVWVLSRRLWLAIPPAVGGVARGFITFTTSILFVQEGIEGFHEKGHDPLVYFVLISSAVADIWITVSLCTLLWRRKTGYRSTIDIINGIIYWTLETGMITTITAVLVLIFFMAFRHAALWNGLVLIYPRLYANSLLVSLNAAGDSGSKKGSRGATIMSADSSDPRSDGVVITRSFNIEMPEYPRLGRPEPKLQPHESMHHALKADQPFDSMFDSKHTEEADAV